MRLERFHTFRRPEVAAQKIITAIEKRKPRLLIGPDAVIISLMSRLFPVSYTRFIPRLDKADHLTSK